MQYVWMCARAFVCACRAFVCLCPGMCARVSVCAYVWSRVRDPQATTTFPSRPKEQRTLALSELSYQPAGLKRDNHRTNMKMAEP